MTDSSSLDQLDTLDSLYLAQEENGGEKDFVDLAEQRYKAAEELYGKYHIETIERLVDYSDELLETDRYRSAFDLYVDLKERVVSGVSQHHPIYVRALLGMCEVYLHDKRAEEAEILFHEATTRARRLVGRKRAGSGLLERIIAVSGSLGKSDVFSEFVQLTLSSGTASLEEVLEAVSKYLKDNAVLAEEQGCDELVQELFQQIQQSEFLDREDRRDLFLSLQRLGQSSAVMTEMILRELLQSYEGEEMESLTEVVEIHVSLALLYMELSDFELARDHYEFAMGLFNERADDQAGESSTSQTLGELAYTFGKVEESKRLLKEALEASLEEAPENADTARIMHNIGTLALADEDRDEAEKYLMNALELKKRHCGAETAETQLTLIALAVLSSGKEDIPTARGYYQQALQIEIELFGEDTNQYMGIQAELMKLDELAGIHASSQSLSADSGQSSSPQATVVEEVDVEIPADAGFFKATKNQSAEKDASAAQEFRSGVLLLHQGKVEEAAKHFEDILANDLRDQRIKQLVLENLADVYFSLGNNERAKECLNQLSV